MVAQSAASPRGRDWCPSRTRSSWKPIFEQTRSDGAAYQLIHRVRAATRRVHRAARRRTLWCPDRSGRRRERDHSDHRDTRRGGTLATPAHAKEVRPTPLSFSCERGRRPEVEVLQLPHRLQQAPWSLGSVAASRPGGQPKSRRATSRQALPDPQGLAAEARTQPMPSAWPSRHPLTDTRAARGGGRSPVRSPPVGRRQLTKPHHPTERRYFPKCGTVNATRPRSLE